MALVKKNLPANAGDIRNAGLIPGSGRFPGGGHAIYLFLSINRDKRGQTLGIQISKIQNPRYSSDFTFSFSVMFSLQSILSLPPLKSRHRTILRKKEIQVTYLNTGQ